MCAKKFDDYDHGEEAVMPEWVDKMKQKSVMYGHDARNLFLLGGLWVVLGPMKLLNMGTVWAIAHMVNGKNELLSRLSWRKSQTDKKSGSETSDRQSMEDSETGEGAEPEVSHADIDGEGEDDQPSNPSEEATERSTPEPHLETGKVVNFGPATGLQEVEEHDDEEHRVT